MSDRELCQAAYQEMYRTMIAKDIPALSAVLDDSFVLVHMTGMRQPKAAFLKAVANGTLNYSSAEHDSMDNCTKITLFLPCSRQQFMIC